MEVIVHYPELESDKQALQQKDLFRQSDLHTLLSAGIFMRLSNTKIDTVYTLDRVFKFSLLWEIKVRCKESHNINLFQELQ